MIIPPASLNADTLNNLMEEFITREGTDYGEHEHLLSQKLALLHPQIMSGEVLIVFDEASESVNLMLKRDYRP